MIRIEITCDNYIASRKLVAFVSLNAGKIDVEVRKSWRCCSLAFCAIVRIWASASRAFFSENRNVVSGQTGVS